ncbi:DUF1285 domain-containing protein [Shewanella marisflavi]|uniref:DUF1285 domain-containing protein n=1 Tax=Shewanella TaxID=22 RepID=UPI003AAD3A15
MTELEPVAQLKQITQGAPLCDERPLFHIDGQGRWFYRQEPLPDKFCRLFATILRRQGEDYLLVTPAEKVLVDVADYPFVIHDYESNEDGSFSLMTSIGSQLSITGYQAFVVGEETISVGLASGLSAKLGRACYYRFIAQYLLHEDEDLG